MTYANYPMYGNNQFYMQDLQAMRDRIDKQMQQMQQQQNQLQMQQPVPQVTQNFQLAPQQNISEIDAKYAENIDEVKNTLALKNTFFINKDMNVLWFKNVAGDIKKYSLIEIIDLDPKDKEIAELKQQIANMQNMMLNNSSQDTKKNSKKGGIDNDTNARDDDEHVKKS